MQESASEEIVGIKNLEAEFDVDLAKELAQAYLDDTATIIDRLTKALNEQDQEGLRSAAHLLKGCSRAIQAWKCDKASSLLESNALDGDWRQAAENLGLVADAYAKTEEFLKQYLAS